MISQLGTVSEEGLSPHPDRSFHSRSTLLLQGRVKKARALSDSDFKQPACHCEEPTGPCEARPDDRLRDEAIQSHGKDSGLLRFARNDGMETHLRIPATRIRVRVMQT